MRTWHLAVAAIIFVVLWTTSVLVWNLLPSRANRSDAPKLELADGKRAINQERPKVVVALKNKNGELERGKMAVDFGVSLAGSKDRAEFMFSNQGVAPLTLRHSQADSSCRCTIGRLSKGEVPPGEQTVVTLEWDTTEQVGPFRHHATIHTNDPDKPRVRLEVNGRVTPGVLILPSPELVMGRMSRDETKTVSFQVESDLGPDLLITSCDVEDPTAIKLFEFKTEKLASEELQEGAQAGFRVHVTLKPGLPLGTFRKRIRLVTNQADPKEVFVLGTVISDITVAGGPGWVAESELLYLGQLDANRGREVVLHLLVRGPRREAIRLQIDEAFPSALQATLGKPEKLKQVVRWPLTVNIPAGTPAMNHLEAANPGRIVIHSNHPEETELTIPIAFAVNQP
jgi:hypothetical protein